MVVGCFDAGEEFSFRVNLHLHGLFSRLIPMDIPFLTK
jgi:hypothetical protein